MIGPDKLKNIIPLTESSFYILISLIEPLHGYGIMQKVEKLSNGRVKLGAGTLYGAISNLEKYNLIEPHTVESGSDRKKMYKVTNDGLEIIKIEIQRLEEMSENAKLLMKEGGNIL